MTIDASFFDRILHRRGTGSMKWDRYEDDDLLPMWVADLDFVSPPPVLEALREAVAASRFGYAEPQNSLVEAVQAMLLERYDWEIEPEWLVWLPGLVCGLNVACRAVGEPGGKVVTGVPIYPPFLSAPRLAGRRRVTFRLQRENEHWEVPMDDIEAAFADEADLLLLCNPHNPVGRCFTRAELEGMAARCLQHDVVICADEIHAGLVLDTACRHQPMAALSPEIADRTITLMAPSKTYNLPGLGCSFAVISNPRLREAFEGVMQGIVPDVNAMGLIAAEAAYRHGESWRQALLDYLRANHQRVREAVRDELPGITTTPVEATYLAWLDVRETGLENPIDHFRRHGVMLSDGRFFRGDGYVRLNFGCPRSLLDEGLRRLREALNSVEVPA